MRSLKFRAWANGYEKWCHHIEYMGDGLWLGYIDDGIGELSTTDIIVEQYTGLKDTNGKEIYEGDIVSYRGNNYQIKWCEASFAYIASSKNQYYWLSPSKSTVFEVIGNIHENPELLEAKE